MACHINLLHVRYVCKTHAHSHSSTCSRLPRYWFSRCSICARMRIGSLACIPIQSTLQGREKLSVCQRSCARFLRVRCLHAARCVPIACRRSRCATIHERLRGCQHAGGQTCMPYVCAIIALLAFSLFLVVALPRLRPRPRQHATLFSRWTKSRSGCMAAQSCECACTRTQVQGCRSRLTA